MRGIRALANLRTEPQVVVQVGRKKWSATARVASSDERARLWPLVNRHNRGFAPLLRPGAHGRYDAYQRATSREIPIVILNATDENAEGFPPMSSRRAH
jgi:deazaflavin-dependent oxidoreductase (nitroreductase family)